jgi:predicted nuclease with TOPRIM domain
MPKSHKRGGQKAHNKRVKARNQRLNGERKKLQQAYTEMFNKRLEELEQQYSGMTEENVITPEVVDVQLEGTTFDTESVVVTDEN